MPSVDVTTAPDRFFTMSVDGYAPGRNRPGNCARWTYFALPTVPNTTPLPSAIAAWENAPKSRRHPIIDGETKIPRGMVIALGPLPGPRWPGDENYRFGDVFVADGDGVGFDAGGPATDAAGSGVIARTTIRERIRVTGGRPLLGFLSHYGGWDLTTSASANPSPSHLIVQEDEMAAPQAVVYTDGKRFVGGDEAAGLFTFGSKAALTAWQKNNPVVRQVAAETLDKLVVKAVRK